MYKFSKYNMLSLNTNGQYYIYNALSKECELISKEVYDLFNKKDVSSIVSNEGMLKILLDKGFIVESEYDETELVEYRVNKEIYRTDILDLTLIMTHACNFQCIYCYQEMEQKPFTDETEKRLLRFIDKQTKKEAKKLYINWFGGEPLVEKERIMSMGYKLMDIVRKNKISYIGRMTTNGYLLDVETFERLIGYHIIYYMVTIDGTREYHDKQRPHKSGYGSYDKIMHNLLEIKKIHRRFTIDIRVNVSKDNIKDIEDFIDEFSENFKGDNRFNLVFEAVHDWKGERIKNHMDVLVDDSNIIKDLYRKTSEKKVAVQNYLEYSSEVQMCPAMKQNGYTISGDGRVFKCEMAMNDCVYSNESEIGYLNEWGQIVKKIYKEVKWLTRDKKMEKCYDCLAYPYCMGGAQCNYGMKFHKQLRCDEYVDYLYWSSELLSKTKEKILC